ncbi:SpoVK/Ycf46/Vps4 family AAA+-type ATPase [Bradyrhizobium japonicum]
MLFVIATNYAERIDSAIKRQGRIDQHLILLPPDRERRKKFVEKLWKPGTIDVDVDAAAAKSVFLSHNDMQFISKTRVGIAAIEKLSATVPSATPDTYVVRFKKRDDDPITDVRRVPMFEFVTMVALEADAAGKVRGTSDWKKEIKDKALDRFEKKPSPKVQRALVNEIARIG